MRPLHHTLPRHGGPPRPRRLPSPPPRCWRQADVLTPGERAALSQAALRADATISSDALAQVLDWARSVRLHAAVLDSVLEGEVDVLLSPDGSELVFRAHADDNVVPLSARR